jgi:hypothetical protein
VQWQTQTLRASAILVATSAVLGVPGALDVGASPFLVVAYLVAGVGLYVTRDEFADAPTVAGHDLGRYGAVLWLVPLVAAGVTLLALDATAAELQALGGLVGLVGMGNYFLRPVYYAVTVLVEYLGQVSA